MKWYFILLGIVMTVGVILIGVLMPPIYSGKVVFETEAEYQEFKQALVDVDATYTPEGMSVLSSEPPIIVTFRGINAHGEDFNYGEDDMWARLFCIPLVVLALWLVIYMISGS